MSETIGNWTVDVLTTDTISSTKNLPIPDLSYAADFTVAKSTSEEVVLINKTGASLRPAEMIRYTRRPVQDVYKSGLSSQLDISNSQRANCTSGVNAYGEIAYMLKATNSVSGEEIVLPMRGAVSFTVPTIDFVSPTALGTLIKRVISVMFDTGKVDGSLATNIARGDLNPADNSNGSDGD